MKLRVSSAVLVSIGIGACGVLSVPVAGAGQDAPPRKPVVRSYINTEFEGPPATLREMAIEADAVIKGKVIGSRPHDEDQPGKIETAYSVRVLEVLQNFGNQPVATADRIEVVRSGGVHERKRDVLSVVDPEFPSFKRGTEYVLFLIWNQNLRSWAVRWGPAGVIELDKGRAHAWSNAKALTATEGRTASEVLDTIRSLKTAAVK